MGATRTVEAIRQETQVSQPVPAGAVRRTQTGSVTSIPAKVVSAGRCSVARAKTMETKVAETRDRATGTTRDPATRHPVMPGAAGVLSWAALTTRNT